MSIEVKEPTGAFIGTWCLNCKSEVDVLHVLITRSDSRTSSSNVIALCTECRAKLAIELVKSLGGRNYDTR